MVKKLYPLCENHLFSRAYRKGRSDANKYVAVYALKNYEKTPNRALAPTRLGITVNKKLGKAGSPVARQAHYPRGLPRKYAVLEKRLSDHRSRTRRGFRKKRQKHADFRCDAQKASKSSDCLRKTPMRPKSEKIRPFAVNRAKISLSNYEIYLYLSDTVLPLNFCRRSKARLPAGSRRPVRNMRLKHIKRTAFLSVRRLVFGASYAATLSEKAAMIPFRRKSALRRKNNRK